MSSDPGLSPYNYTANNPIGYVDPNGQRRMNAQEYNYLVPIMQQAMRAYHESIGYHTSAKENWDWALQVEEATKLDIQISNKVIRRQSSNLMTVLQGLAGAVLPFLDVDPYPNILHAKDPDFDSQVEQFFGGEIEVTVRSPELMNIQRVILSKGYDGDAQLSYLQFKNKDGDVIIQIKLNLEQAEKAEKQLNSYQQAGREREVNERQSRSHKDQYGIVRDKDGLYTADQ